LSCASDFPTIDSGYEAERFGVLRLTDANAMPLAASSQKFLLLVQQEPNAQFEKHFLTLAHAFRELLDGGLLCGILNTALYPAAATYLGLQGTTTPTVLGLQASGRIKKQLFKVPLSADMLEPPQGKALPPIQAAMRSAAIKLSKALRLSKPNLPVAPDELLARGANEALRSRVFHKNESVALFNSADNTVREKISTFCKGVAPGSQASLDRVAIEDLDRRTYLCRYAYPGRPFLLTGATKGWPAVEKWSPDYFAKMIGEYELHGVDMGIEDWYTSGSMSMKAFVENVMKPMRNKTEAPPWSVPYAGFSMGDLVDEDNQIRINDVLGKDYMTPPIFTNGNWFTCMQERCQQDMAIVFMGSKGARQSNHQDHFSSSKWQTQIYGRKRWILHPPELSHALYYGKVDPFFPDLQQYPRYEAAIKKRFDVVVEAGEVMWWPSGWWHTTHSLEDGIGLARNLLDEHNYASFEISMKQFCERFPIDYPLESGASYCGCMKRNHKRFTKWYQGWRSAAEHDTQMSCKTYHLGGQTRE